MRNFRIIISLLAFALVAAGCSEKELQEGKVKDHQGNVYKTVRIGTQTWMAENMRCTVTPTGRYLLKNADSYRLPYYVCLDDTLAADGNLTNEYLYNLPAALDMDSSAVCEPIPFQHIRGICPEGWHIPTVADWDTLLTYVAKTYPSAEGTRSYAKSLASKDGWVISNKDETPGKNPELNNRTGFNAVPSGAFMHVGNGVLNFRNIGTCAYFLSATQVYGGGNWMCCRVDYNGDSLVQSAWDRQWAVSVRCIKDYDIAAMYSGYDN